MPLTFLPLSKEIFWNRISKKYPYAFSKFSAWIDDYKTKVEWQKLFNYGQKNYNNGFPIRHNPKFHDLPSAMQLGIFIQYIGEQHYFLDSVRINSLSDIQEFIESYFKTILEP